MVDEFDDLNKKFNEYMKEYKKVDIPTKRKIIIDSLKNLIASIEVLGETEGIELHSLHNGEVLDLREEFVSEDDYLEGMLVYLETAKNLIGEYLMHKN